MTGVYVVHPDGTVDAPVADYDASCDTEFGLQIDQHAWSQAEPLDEVATRDHHDWPHVWRLVAAVGAAVCVVLAGLGLWMNPPWHPESDPPIATAATPTPAAKTVDPPDPPPLVLPTVMAAHQTQDGDYLQRLRAAGMVSVIPQQDINYAQASCEDLANGPSDRGCDLHHPPVSSLGAGVDRVGVGAGHPHRCRGLLPGVGVMAEQRVTCHHIYRVVYRFGVPILVCMRCAKETP